LIDMEKQNKYRVGIIGGGVAGISAANELIKYPEVEVTILEKTTALGGLNQCVELDGLKYDIGTFLYPNDHALLMTFPFLREIYLPIEHYPIAVKDKDKIDVHPISIKGYWKNHGTINFILSIWSLLFAKIKNRNIKTLPQYCEYYLGERIYKKSGLKSYIKRLYKKDDTEVDLKFGYARIKEFKNYSLRNIIKRLGKLDGDFIFNAKKRTFYARPDSGFKIAFDRLEDHLKTNNVSIFKNINISHIEKKAQGFKVNTNEDSYYFDRIIATIPFSITQKLLGLQTNFTPSYMSLCTLFYTGKSKHDTNVIYNYTEEGEWKRITLYSKYYGKHEGLDYISVEITFNSKEQPNIAAYKSEFEKLTSKYDIIKDLKFTGQKITPYAYPLFNKGEIDLADKELDGIRAFGIDLVGRQGTFEYLSSDDTILTTQAYMRDSFIPTLLPL